MHCMLRQGLQSLSVGSQVSLSIYREVWCFLATCTSSSFPSVGKHRVSLHSLLPLCSLWLLLHPCMPFTCSLPACITRQ